MPMFELNAYLWGLIVILAVATVTWIVSFYKQDVSIVDRVWGPFFAVGTLVYAVTLSELGPRTPLMLILIALWAIRLAAYITWRNWGTPEEQRYQEIRRNNEPHFAVKSLYIVFGLQGVLAWIISLPLLTAMAGLDPLGLLDWLGATLWLIGMVFEAGGDWQLMRFKQRPENDGQVMDQGLWRYTRHPNYFGEFCIWWGFYLLALAAGGWWTVISPLLMSFLLLRISGVTLLERNICERRPAYREYKMRTNAFFPGIPRNP